MRPGNSFSLRKLLRRRRNEARRMWRWAFVAGRRGPQPQLPWRVSRRILRMTVLHDAPLSAPAAVAGEPADLANADLHGFSLLAVSLDPPTVGSQGDDDPFGRGYFDPRRAGGEISGLAR